MAATKSTKVFNYTGIPSDWENIELGKKLDIITGFAFPSEKFSESGVKLLRGSNVKRNQLDWNDGITRYWQHDPALEKFELKIDDLVIALDGALIGRSYAKIKEDDLPSYLVQRVARLRGKGIDQSFLHTLFTQRSFELHVDSVKTHTAIPHISPNDIKKFRVNLPPLPEQKAIAQVLSTADVAFNTIEKLIAQKELRKKWLMQNLLTGKIRLKGFGGEWKEKKLEYFIKEFKQKPSAEDNYQVLTSAKSGLMKQTDYYGDNRITNRDDADYNVIPPNYLTYRSRSDDGLFTFNKNDLGITGLISGYYPVFTIKNGDIDFILMYMNYYRQKLSKYAIGTSQLVLAMNALKEAKFHLPNDQEQTAIAQVLQVADKEIALSKAKAEKLRELKKGMMQVLLTGKVRLKL